jgi:hypothetical protein
LDLRVLDSTCIFGTWSAAWLSTHSVHCISKSGHYRGPFATKYFRSHVWSDFGRPSGLRFIAITDLGPASEARVRAGFRGYFSILTSAGGSARSPILDWCPRPS